MHKLNNIMQKLKDFGATKIVIKSFAPYNNIPPRVALNTNKREHEQAVEEEKQQIDINLWSELDGNLLGEILSRLCLADQARFRVVCKNWLAAHPINTKTLLPWYLCFDYSHKQFDFRLYDPSSQNLASVFSISPTKLGIRFSSDTTLAAIVKHNWLFICIHRRNSFSGLSYINILLFSPFTRKIITLPKLIYSLRYSPLHFSSMTCSTQPDSPDCVFHLLDSGHTDKFVLLTYRNGDKKWTAKQFNRVDNILPNLCRLVYLHGMLYIVSPYGQLASYDIVGGKFKFESLLIDEQLALNFRSFRKMRVLELNGEVVIVYLGSNAGKGVSLPGKQCIKRYNPSTKAWIPVSSLGNKALFVSDKTSEVTKIDEIDMRNDGVLSNKITHFFDGGCVVYSIQDGELVEFKPANSNLEDTGSNLSEYKNRYCSTFSAANRSVYWLEPPCVQACSS